MVTSTWECGPRQAKFMYLNGHMMVLRTNLLLLFLLISFHANSQENSADDITFIENSGFTALDDVLEQFEGKVVLLDFWATWCRPCIQEFAFYEKLEDFRTENPDIAILYVSLDVNRKEKWMNFVEQEKLNGYHLLVDQPLHISLYEELGVSTIPRYMIVDRSGKVINRNAARPSQGKTLIKQLARALDKGP